MLSGHLSFCAFQVLTLSNLWKIAEDRRKAFIGLILFRHFDDIHCSIVHYTAFPSKLSCFRAPAASWKSVAVHQERLHGRRSKGQASCIALLHHFHSSFHIFPIFFPVLSQIGVRIPGESGENPTICWTLLAVGRADQSMASVKHETEVLKRMASVLPQYVWSLKLPTACWSSLDICAHRSLAPGILRTYTATSSEKHLCTEMRPQTFKIMSCCDLLKARPMHSSWQ